MPNDLRSLNTSLVSYQHPIVRSGRRRAEDSVRLAVSLGAHRRKMSWGNRYTLFHSRRAVKFPSRLLRATDLCMNQIHGSAVAVSYPIIDASAVVQCQKPKHGSAKLVHVL
ncbi:hypothetical protein XPA_010150 [Xanthoria parietina]